MVGILAVIAVLIIAYALYPDKHPDRQAEVTNLARSRHELGAEPISFAGGRVVNADPLTQVMRILKTQPERQSRLLAAFASWQKDQPELARKLMALMSERLCGAPSVSKAELKWSEAELQQGINLSLKLEKTDELLPLFSELAGHLATTSPTEAIAAVEFFPGTMPEKEQILGEVVDKWVLADPGGAAEWVCSASSGTVRETMLTRIVQSLVQVDPARAAAIVAKDFESPEAEANSVRTVVGRWSWVNPTATANWLCRFPATELRREMLQVLTVTWASQDHASLVNWIQALPADEFRSEVEAVSRHLGETALSQTAIPVH